MVCSFVDSRIHIQCINLRILLVNFFNIVCAIRNIFLPTRIFPFPRSHQFFADLAVQCNLIFFGTQVFIENYYCFSCFAFDFTLVIKCVTVHRVNKGCPCRYRNQMFYPTQGYFFNQFWLMLLVTPFFFTPNEKKALISDVINRIQNLKCSVILGNKVRNNHFHKLSQR